MTGLDLYEGKEYSLKRDKSFKLLLPSEKGHTLKEKNLLPTGEKSFLLEYSPFQKGLGMQGSKKEVTKIVFLGRNSGKSTESI